MSSQNQNSANNKIVKLNNIKSRQNMQNLFKTVELNKRSQYSKKSLQELDLKADNFITFCEVPSTAKHQTTQSLEINIKETQTQKDSKSSFYSNQKTSIPKVQSAFKCEKEQIFQGILSPRDTVDSKHSLNQTGSFTPPNESVLLLSQKSNQDFVQRLSMPMSQDQKRYNAFHYGIRLSPKTAITEGNLMQNESADIQRSQIAAREVENQQKRISELETQLINAQAQLIESGKTIDKLRKSVRRQRSKRSSLLRTKTAEIKETTLEHQKKITDIKQEYLELKVSKDNHISNLQQELDRMYKIIEALNDENVFLKQQHEAMNSDINRCLRPEQHSFNDIKYEANNDSFEHPVMNESK